MTKLQNFLKDSSSSNRANYAIISYSGGMDSTCLALELLSRKYEVRTISFDYGQSHSIELKRAKQNIKYLQRLGLPITHQVINLRDVFSDSTSCLVTGDHAPEGHYEDSNMKTTVVSNRNIIFSSIIFSKALDWAKRLNHPVVISLGVHAGDHAIYPDCTEESVNMAKELYRISNWDSELVEYEAPFVDFSKAEVLNCGGSAAKLMGLTKSQFNKIMKNTISCYNANETGLSCGKCGTCTERLEAFAANGLKDPAPYTTM